MSKPEDIPQSVWDKAEGHRQLWARGPGSVKEAVARAILAAKAEEREACAQIADEEQRLRYANATAAQNGSLDWGNPQEAMMAQGHKSVTAMTIAAAIRKREEPTQ